MAEVTKVWQYYQAGINYNNRLEPNYYDDIDINLDFFRGQQWRGLEEDEDDELPHPVLNFVRRFITFFVASLTTSNLKIHLSPYLQSSAEIEGMTNEQLTEMVNSHIEFLLEKFKMEYRLRETCFDGAITGDGCAHFYFDPTINPYGAESGETQGEIVMELADCANVMFGNPNNSDKESQPYILITGRDTIANLRKEAIERGMDEFEADSIVADSEFQYQAGDNATIENEDIEEFGKALFIYCYMRDPETGTIKVSKSTMNTMIFEEIDTGLTKYPIAWFNWEKQKNTYHGVSVASSLINTQIFINQMVAMIMYHLLMSAFPKIVYDKNMLPDGPDNRVGRSIGVDNLEAHPIDTIIGQIQPSVMSTQIMESLELIVGYFKETAGISDASLGNVNNPKNTSALIAVQEATAVPLANVAANMSEWMESIGEILVDMMATYYGVRPLVLKQDDGRVLQEFDFTQLKNIWLNVTCNVGETTKYSEITAIQTLSNLLNGKFIDFVQFLKRIPDGYLPDKESLIDEIEMKMAQAQQMEQPQEQPASQQQPEQPNPLAGLSDEELAVFNQQLPEVQQQLLEQIASQV